MLGACDLGSRDDEPSHGAPLHVLSTYPSDGDGIGCGFAGEAGAAGAGGDCAVPRNAEIELRFDRFLFPVGLGAGLILYSGDPQADAVALGEPFYDPVERVLIFSHDTLRPNALYTAEVVVSSGFGSGFWAFDGAPLEAGPVPLRFSFRTGADEAVVVPPPQILDTCDTLTLPSPTSDALPNSLVTCASQGPEMTCHVTSTVGVAKMGLDLHDPWGVLNTAIGHVAHEADTAIVGGSPLPANFRFGTGMPIVTRGAPEDSYLLYKLLRKPENYGGSQACSDTRHPELPLPAGSCVYASDDERTALREWFSRGEPMPRDDNGAKHLTRDDLEAIVRWIRNDAPCQVVR